MTAVLIYINFAYHIDDGINNSSNIFSILKYKYFVFLLFKLRTKEKDGYVRWVKSVRMASAKNIFGRL